MENEHDNEQPEVIRQEMQETRTALSEKLEALEQHLVGTVQDARSAVKDTVNTVKDAVQETVSTVKETIGGTADTIKDSISGTTDTIKESIGGTTDSIKQSITGSVESVKESFDIERQAVRHPWLVFGGSVAVGYVGGLMLRRLSQPAGPAYGAAYLPSGTVGNRGPARAADTGAAGRTPAYAASSGAASSSTGEAQQGNGFLQQAAAAAGASSLVNMFEPELNRLKGVAIGALFGVLRDTLERSLPPTLRPQVTELINNVTTKIGGQPVEGHILQDTPSTGSTTTSTVR